MDILSGQMIGIDEVGYGAWAGPLFICALRFLKKPEIQFFDSKILSPSRREKLFENMHEIAEWQIGEASVEEINTYGLGKAYSIALARAIDGMEGEKYIDGIARRGFDVIPVVKGDQTMQVISAASIVAKVLRDRRMNKLALQYIHYGWEKNKGYGTKQHADAILQHGKCVQHRSYNLKILRD